MAKENGWLVTDDFSKYDGNREAVVSYPQLPKEVIDEEFRKAKDIIAKFDIEMFVEYIMKAYKYKGIVGTFTFILKKTPSYMLRLLRKQMFKLRTRKPY